jgi:SulP family sulfate permease
VSLDATRLVALDTTGVDALEQLVEALERRGGRLDILHLNEQPRDLLLRSGLAARLRTCC